MPRIVRGSAIAALTLLAVGAAAYAARGAHERAPDPSDALSAAAQFEEWPNDGAPTETPTPRGSVTIDLGRQQLIGVRTVSVKRAALEHSVRALGSVRYDETRLTDINLKVDGWIRDLAVNFIGQAIHEGQLLLSVYSPELFTLQNDYLLVLSTRQQIPQSAPDAIPQADDLVMRTRRRLELRDMPAADIRALDQSHEAREVVSIASPVTGVVIEKQAMRGMHVTAGQSLFKVADLSIVWLEAD